MKRYIVAVFVFVISPYVGNTFAVGVHKIKLKDLSRVVGVRDNALTGYGIVSGLNGTGDTSRNRLTIQSISNIMQKFGIKVDPRQIYSRNVAAVLVTASLPAFSRAGDKLDVTVSSVGDARSLQGGTLILTHLKGPDGKIYALVQGALLTGGYKVESRNNLVQKNHTTTARIPNGATVEARVNSRYVGRSGAIELKLYSPDFTTSKRIVNLINKNFGRKVAVAMDAGSIKISIPQSHRGNVVAFISAIELLTVTPDTKARIVVNERTGSIVAGGNVKISSINVTHGGLRVSVMTDFIVSQPGFVRQSEGGARTTVVPDTSIKVKEKEPINIYFKKETTVFKLVAALNRVKASTRDIISILQSIKRAGALHAELIIQ